MNNHKLATGDTLPSYRKPPVNEVVCGLEFQTSDKLLLTHVGLLWEKFRKDYPNIKHAVPIVSSSGNIQTDPGTGLPIPRVWFISKKDDQLIQFQADRFYFNWRRQKEEYPRYPYVIRCFKQVMKTIEDFFREYQIADLVPIEYELTYINHFVQGTEWNSMADMSRIFIDFHWETIEGRFLPSPSTILWSARFDLPEQKGFMSTTAKKAARLDDKANLIILEITAKSPSEPKDKQYFLEWFDLAHEWIVKGFTDLTTKEVQTKYWERER